VRDVMQTYEDTQLRREPISALEDHDLSDEFTRSAHTRWWYAAIVVLDALAILAFIVWVVLPKLT
jgi:hypothetical protein